MRAQDSMNVDFRLVDAAWSPSLAHARLEQSQSLYALVRRREGQELYFYVFERQEILKRLLASKAADVRLALDLHEHQATPTIAPHARIDLSGPRVVVGARAPLGIVVPRQPSMRGGHKTRNGATQIIPSGQLSSAVKATKPGGDGPNANKEVTRHLTARLPATVTPGKTFHVTVDLTATSQVGSAAMPFAKPVGSKIVVLVQPLEGLSVVGPDDGEIEVIDPQPEQPLVFTLKAGETGAGSLRVLALCNGTSIAALTLTTSIAPTFDGTESTVDAAVIDAGPRSQPDLTMCILERRGELNFELWSADGSLYRKKFGPIDLKANPLEYFRTQFRDIENLPLKTAQQRRDAQKRMERKGANLFDQVFPSELKVLLWDQRDRIKTVQISSDEPWIPWELCRLTGKVDGNPSEGQFFAEAFWVTRWLTGVGPSRTISLDNIALVVPSDSNLDQAPEEKKFVLSLANGGRKVTEVDATYSAVTGAMEKGLHDGWHFTGHAHADQGNDADQAGIELTNGEELRPEDISGNVGRALQKRPFIFFNACQSAQAGLSLTGLGGWASRFIQPGNSDYAASAFVGSYWSVYDEAALGFAKKLYEGLLVDRKPIGQAAREARLAIRQKEDPTWLAYTVYADPFATAKGE